MYSTVWFYFRLAVTYREVEEMMAVRSMVLTYEAIGEWYLKCGLPQPLRVAGEAWKPCLLYLLRLQMARSVNFVDIGSPDPS
jgi:hypothetical protein